MDTLQLALVNEVKNFARANYEMDGWDYIVGCFSDEDILEAIGTAKTAAQAIRNVGRQCKAQDDYRKGIQATAF